MASYLPVFNAMLRFIQILSITLVAMAMVPAVAHALEYPGKKRLNRDAYITVQGIYYPGFTVLGIAEPGAILAVIALLLLVEESEPAFWLTLAALLGLLAMHAVYWILVHPTNRYWLQSGDVSLGKAGGGFFALDPGGRGSAGELDWTRFRDRWEYSHIARAVLAFVSFLSLLLTAFVPSLNRVRSSLRHRMGQPDRASRHDQRRRDNKCAQHRELRILQLERAFEILSRRGRLAKPAQRDGEN
jgi:anthrone oxygenase-like protein